MPSLRTKLPGFPHYDSLMVRAMASRRYLSRIQGMGPIAIWPFIDVAGLTAADYGVNKLDATYTACTLSDASGPGASMGKVALFNGTSSLVQLPAASLNAFFKPNTVTMSIWVNLNEAWSTATARDIWWIGVNGSNYFAMYKGSANSITCACNFGGTGATPFIAMTGLSGWHHIALTADRNGTGKITPYLDGIAKTAGNMGGAWSGTLGNAQTRLSFAGDGYWKGWFGWAVPFDRVLTPAEVAFLATAV